MDWEEMYEILKDCLGLSEDTLDLAFAVGGCNEETAERILFYYTGWSSFKGFLGELDEEEEE